MGAGMNDWSELGLRDLPPRSARTRVVGVPPIQELIQQALGFDRSELSMPVRGVTCDGEIVPGLFASRPGTVDTAPLRDSALAFLAALDPGSRSDATFPLEARRAAGVVQCPPERFPPRRHARNSRRQAAPTRN
jgi:hypothetical protein